MKRKLIVLVVLLLLGFIGVLWHFYPQFAIANGYVAKKICTATLASDRIQTDVENQDLYFSILGKVSSNIDKNKNQVTSALFGMSPRVCVYRKGIGCILLDGKDDFNTTFPESIPPEMPDNRLNWPYGNQELVALTTGTNGIALKKAIDGVFDSGDNLSLIRTTSVVVIHRDTIVGERYFYTFDKTTPQLGWSMTKSLMNTFVGLMVKDSTLTIQKNNLFPEWSGDSRKDITLNNLLQMNSGLEWSEDYTTVSDATNMLYNAQDIATIPLSKPLKYTPESHWCYSSGTTNLISKLLRNVIHDDKKYLTYLKTRLFNPLGMTSAFIETDESGTFIGSSYGYATARDWAKYGLLYLHDGVWNGNRLLPEGWTKYSAMEAKGSDGVYGAQFWLNKDSSEYPDVPADMYSANGFHGQHVYIIPSRDVVVVRLGTGDEAFDGNTFLKEILAALPKNK
ncbi:MAG: serine hydrolase [Saprospiraceae bacterium]|nr:serine hydrolase [Saprospiraceae bacterium]